MTTKDSTVELTSNSFPPVTVTELTEMAGHLLDDPNVVQLGYEGLREAMVEQGYNDILEKCGRSLTKSFC